MAEVNEEDVKRLADILTEADCYGAQSYMDQARNALKAGVTLPPEPPKWTVASEYPHVITFGREDGDPAWSGQWYIGTFHKGAGTPKRAQRLADHLNATGFMPDGEDG